MQEGLRLMQRHADPCDASPFALLSDVLGRSLLGETDDRWPEALKRLRAYACSGGAFGAASAAGAAASASALQSSSPDS